jgi:hypothetical protein
MTRKPSADFSGYRQRRARQQDKGFSAAILIAGVL